MNWSAISTIVEIIGTIAVVISLLFLGFQIRIQNKEARIASVHEILEGFRVELSTFKSAENAQVWSKGIENFNELSNPEKIQFISMTIGPLRVYEEAYFQFLNGRLEKSQWLPLSTQLKDLLTNSGCKHAWELRKHSFNDEFKLYADSLKKGLYKLQ